jgi:hypothetical protein
MKPQFNQRMTISEIGEKTQLLQPAKPSKKVALIYGLTFLFLLGASSVLADTSKGSDDKNEFSIHSVFNTPIFTSTSLAAFPENGTGIVLEVNTYDNKAVDNTITLNNKITPTIISITSTNEDGTYGIGEKIYIVVKLSEAVFDFDLFSFIDLETGTTDRRSEENVGGNGSDTFTFTYIVQTGDYSSRLELTGNNAFASNSDLALPTGSNSLSGSKNISIDGIVPTINSITSTKANGTYGVGEEIPILVTFSKEVTFNSGGLSLAAGSTDHLLSTISSGDGTNTWTFIYTVEAGEYTNDLSINSIAISATDGASNSLDSFTLPAGSNSLSGSKNIVIDTSPQVTNVTSSTSNGSSWKGRSISIQVTFDQEVTVTGTPQLELETGSTDQKANYASGSGSNELTFTYSVQEDDESSDLDYKSTNSLTLNSGTIEGGGQDADLTLPNPGASGSLGANKALVIDGIVPSVVSITSTTSNGTYGVGDEIDIVVTFNEAVTVGGGTTVLYLETGATDRFAYSLSGNGTATWTFEFTVQAGDNTSDLSVESFFANAGDAVGNFLGTATLPSGSNSLSGSKNIVIDTSPQVTNVTSSTSNGSSWKGRSISIQVTFDQEVTVTGTPQLELETGSTDQKANYASGSGSNELTFTYSVQEDDESSDLDYKSTNSLTLNSGTIEGGGQDADLTLPNPGASGSLGANKALVIDGIVPSVVSITSTTSNGTYGVGDEIDIVVTFNEVVTVGGGTTVLYLETGATDRFAYSLSGNGTATWTFEYTVQAGDNTSDLSVESFFANAGDAVGNFLGTATLPSGSNSLVGSKNIVIDGVVPEFTSTTTANFAENGTGVAYTATADDGTALTFSFGSGNDEALFNIDANTGEVTFITTPDFENPTNADTDNAYVVNVIATDEAGNTANQDITITVTDVNDFTPVFTSAALAAFAENSTGTVLDVNANDGDGGTDDTGITYSLSGTDAADFSISATGLLTFNSSPDFDVPTDEDGNNIYQITVTADDNSENNNTSEQNISVVVTPLVEEGVNSQLPWGADINGEAAGDESGISVSISANGSVLAIGANENDGNGAGSGHVRVYTWNGSAWIQQGNDIDGEAAGDYSGISTSINADGSVLAIGAIYNADNGALSGHVRVYTWDGNAWVKQGEDIDGEAAGDQSGGAVSLSADGSVLAIGATENAGNGAGSGHVRVYTWNGSAWTQQGADLDGEAAGDQSGGSVSLSADGSILAIGAFNNAGNGSNSGHVRVYGWNGSAWTQQGIDIDGEATDDQSGVVSLSADGSILAIGALGNDGNGADSGHVRVYVWNGSAWTQQGTDIDGETEGDSSGQSVSLSADGSVLAIGARHNNDNGFYSGHARVYAWNGSSWIQQGTDINGEATNDQSGRSVSLSANGAFLAIGARRNAGNGSNSGHVRTYQLIDNKPVIISSTTTSFAENSTDTVLDVNANDGESGETDANLTYSLTAGDDNDLFDISSTGLITFKAAPDFESPQDADTNNDYVVEVNAADATTTIRQTVTITVTDVDEVPIITTSTSANFAENGTGTVLDVNANDAFGGADDLGITYSLTEGGDNDFFAISSTGLITFKLSPDFESPQDADLNNEYLVEVKAQDDQGTTQQSVTISVTNVDESPIITSAATASFNENATGTILDVNANDGDGGATDANLNYSLMVGGDNDLFAISSAGLVTFKEVPDFESPQDANGDNEYVIEINTSDANNTTSQTLTITVTNIGEVPVFTSSGTAVFSENALGTVLDINANNGEGGADDIDIAYSLSGTDAVNFSISTAGLLTFNVSPDFDDPSDSDSDGDNIHRITVTADDGSGNNNTSTQELMVIVTPLVEEGVNTQVQWGADIDGEAEGDYAGTAVALSADGSVLAIGATQNAGNGMRSGHVRVFKWNGSAWTQQGTDIDGDAAFDLSGGTLSLSRDGSVLAIGAIGNEANGTESGHVRVYVWDGSAWMQLGSDIDGEASGDYSGESVSLNVDGSVLAIGASRNTGNGTNSGHVRVFVWNESSWTQRGADIDGEAENDYSGRTVSLSIDGSVLAIGAIGNSSNSGHVRVYRWNGITWTQQGEDIDGEAEGDSSGIAINLSADGSVLAIGATGNDGNGTSSGQVRVYLWNGSAWIQQGDDIDGESFGDSSGGSVSLSADGSVLAVGAKNNRGSGSLSGHVRIYAWNGSAWVQQGPDIDGEAAEDASGVVSLSADGSFLAIGATKNDGNGSNSGQVRVYQLVDKTPIMNSSATASFAENATGTVLDVNANNGDGGADDSGITYSLTASGDNDLFDISGTGLITFKASPDFENPQDADANNDYIIEINAADASNTSKQTVTVMVTDVDDTPPVISSVSFDNIGAKVGDVVFVSIVTQNTEASDGDLVLVSGTINGVAVTNFRYFGLQLYIAEYTVQEGDTDRASGDDIPVSFVLADAAGNESAEYNTAVSQEGDIIDANSPTATITLDDSEIRQGETAELTVTFSEVVTGLEVDDFTVPNGAISEPSSADGGTTYMATFTPNVGLEDQTNVIILDMTGVEDAAGNQGEGTQSSDNFTIDSDPPVIVFTETTSTGAESVSSNKFDVMLVWASAQTVTVDYTVSGTATGSGTDYTLQNGTLTFDADERNKEITIDGIVDDAITETNETVIITLFNPVNGELGTNSVHTYTITDNDAATLSVGEVSHAEGNSGTTILNIPVTLTGQVAESFTVEADAIAWGDDTEADANDFTPVSTVLTFVGNDGEVQNVQVTINGDEVVENDETFAATIGNLVTNGQNISISIPDALATITNDDAATISISSVSGTEDDDPTTPELSFTITLNGAVESGFSVDANASEGTADASDYATGGPVTFNFSGTDGETKIYDALISPDDLVEGQETFTVSLSNLITNGYNVTLGTSTGTGTINDDDATPVITSGTTATLNENETATGYTATGTDADNGTLTFSLDTRSDASLFAIDANTGVLTFNSAPDFENPGDGDSGNDYVVEVKVSDGANEVSQSVTISVTDVDDEAPVFTSSSSTDFDENETGTVYTAIATDVDSNTITYSLANSNEKDVTGLFNLDASTGVLTFINVPDFEAGDGNKNNNKDFAIDIEATDGSGNKSTQSLTVSLSDRDELATFVSNPVITINDNELYEYLGFITDEDEDLSFTVNSINATELPSWLQMNTTKPRLNMASLTFDGEEVGRDIRFEEPTVTDGNGNLFAIAGGLIRINRNGEISPLEVIDNSDELIPIDFIIAMTIDADDNIYMSAVVDDELEILKVSTDGIGTIINITEGEIDLDFPIDMAIDEEGVLYMIEETGSIKALDTTTGSLSLLIDDLGASQLALDSDHNMYVYLPGSESPENASLMILPWIEEEQTFDEARSIDVSFPPATINELIVSSNGDLLALFWDSVFEIDLLTGQIDELNFSDGSDDYEEFNSLLREVSVLGISENNGIINLLTDGGLIQLSRGETILVDSDDPLEINTPSWEVTPMFSGLGTTIDLTEVFNFRLIAFNNDGYSLLYDGERIGIVYKNLFSDIAPEVLFGGQSESGGEGAGIYEINSIQANAQGDFIITTATNIYRMTSEYLGALGLSEVADFNFSEYFDVLFSSETQLPEGYIYSASVDSQGNVSFIHYDANTEIPALYKADNTGQLVSNFIDSESPFFDEPEAENLSYLFSLVIDKNDNLYYSDPLNQLILKLDDQGLLTKFSSGIEALSLTVTGTTLYATTDDQLFKISSEGTPISLAGVAVSNTQVDGLGTDARFDQVDILAANESEGLIYLIDDRVLRTATLKSADFSLTGDPIGQVGTHNVTLKVASFDSDGSNEQEFTITVLDATAPTITSEASLEIPENTNDLIHAVTATDTNTSAVLSYSISGTDASKFDIDSETGELTFISPPDFENPADDGTDNIYAIIVTVADDAENESTQELTVTVTDLDDESPIITSDGGGEIASLNIAENVVEVTTITATDADANSTISYSISGGVDQASFEINNGALAFVSARDFEHPTDNETNNTYVVEVTASDGTNEDVQTITVTITDVDEIDPIFTSLTTATFAENGTEAAYAIVATDDNELTYSLGTDHDEALFSVTAGIVTFISSPDFETPEDGNIDNTYVIEVFASDGLNAVSQTVTISVTDVFEDPSVPNLIGSSPVDGATGFSGTAITLTFDRNIFKGSGAISVSDATDDSGLFTIGVNHPNVTINGKTVTIEMGIALPLDKEVYLSIPTKAFKDTDDQFYQGITDKTTLNFSTPTSPVLESSNPADGGTEFDGTEISLTFDREVTKGSGAISVRDASDDSELWIIGVNHPDVTIVGSTVTLNMRSPLPLDKEAYLTIAATAFKDANGSFYAGIADNSTLNFSTLTSPLLESSDPLDGGIEFDGTEISLTFDREVTKGSGAISVRDASDDSELWIIGVNHPDVTIVGRTVTLNMKSALPLDKEVYLNIAPTAFKDDNGSFYAGIADNSTLNFFTPTSPMLESSNPADGGTEFDGTEISLTFDREVTKGSGAISVRDASDDSELWIIGVNHPDVTIVGRTVTLNMKSALPLDKEVYLNIAPTAFKDDNGSFYAGITNKTTLNFFTPTTPKLISSAPADNALGWASQILTLTFDRDVFKGSGSLLVINASGDVVLWNKGVNHNSISINGSVVTIRTGRSLGADMDLYVNIATTAFKDANGYFYSGVSDKTTLNFSTINSGGGSPAPFDLGEDVIVMDAKAFSIYPNPATNEVTINLSKVGEAPTVIITNLSGMEMYRNAKVETEQLTIDVNSYSQGVFLITVTTDFGEVIRKKMSVIR